MFLFLYFSKESLLEKEHQISVLSEVIDNKNNLIASLSRDADSQSTRLFQLKRQQDQQATALDSLNSLRDTFLKTVNTIKDQGDEYERLLRLAEKNGKKERKKEFYLGLGRRLLPAFLPSTSSRFPLISLRSCPSLPLFSSVSDLKSTFSRISGLMDEVHQRQSLHQHFIPRRSMELFEERALKEKEMARKQTMGFTQALEKQIDALQLEEKKEEKWMEEVRFLFSH